MQTDNPRTQPTKIDGSGVAVQPFSGPGKIYVEGRRPDIQVPMRETPLTDTVASY
jgi:hypothetical protein